MSERDTGRGARTGVRVGLAAAAALCCGAPPGPAREVAAVEVSQPSPTPTKAPTSEIRLPVAQVPAAVAEAEANEAEAEAPGPRVPPPGTPPAIARVFQRLPVAIQDQPPVGGIGATGIHVDKVWLGQSYEREGCTGEAERFSLARHKQVNLCLRVVHSRVEESVEVLWEKDGQPFRRRSLQIPDLHAYRTRAYLVLRREYIGSWRARVLSVDGVELAVKTFEVVE